MLSEGHYNFEGPGDPDAVKAALDSGKVVYFNVYNKNKIYLVIGRVEMGGVTEDALFFDDQGVLKTISLYS